METYHHKNHKTQNLVGKLITLVQLIMSVTCIIIMWNSGMVPNIYMIPAGILMLAFFAITHSLQYMRKKVLHIIGIIISIIMSIVLIVGSFAMFRADNVMKKVGGATYKTDNMVVVVRKEDKAENIMDAKNYRFGYQTAVDQDNNQKMLNDVQSVVGRDVKLVEYSSLLDEAQALLDGKVEAAIYNEGFSSLIEENIEDYSDNVRILYQYGINTEIKQEEDKNVEQPFNIYISGIDVAGPITTNSRSDVNIIMTVNPNTHKILLTTTPRDYYVTIPNISGDARDKLTHAGIYGVDASMETLEQLYGIDITYYARVNFTSLIKIVDALGGVDVNSEVEFSAGGFTYHKGINHMNGEQALRFSRERHSFEEGDNQRGKDQEAVLTAILQKAMSSAILTNANEILTNVSDSVETNMTSDEMAKFINMQLSDGSSWSIESEAATGTGDSQACFSSGSQLLYVMWPDETMVGDISNKMKSVLEE